MQVETIFTGVGHSIRRQSLPHIRTTRGEYNPVTEKLLDLGCVAGNFLQSVKATSNPGVYREGMVRLLKPEGIAILTGAIQYDDEPDFDILLENFPQGFHEPYYDSYCGLILTGFSLKQASGV